MAGSTRTYSLQSFLPQRLETHLIGGIPKEISLFGYTTNKNRLKLSTFPHYLLYLCLVYACGLA